MALIVDVVVKYCSLGWELDCLELCGPPFRKLYTVIYQLQNEGYQYKYSFMKLDYSK